MSALSEWAERCYKDGIICYRLESANDTTGLYQTKSQYGNGVPCYMWTTPVYHVWIDDKNITSTTSYKDAYATYTNRIKEQML